MLTSQVGYRDDASESWVVRGDIEAQLMLGGSDGGGLWKEWIAWHLTNPVHDG